MLEEQSTPAQQPVDSGQIRLRVRRRPAETPPANQKPRVSVQRITGLAPMSRVTTSFGEVHAHVLRKGDMVRTTMGHFARIEKVDRIRLDEEFVARYPDVVPVRIRKNALGADVPKVDTMFAPFQELRAGPARSAAKMVPAMELLSRPFVDRANERQITYTRIYLDRPAEIMCEGMAVPVTC